jgi:hypothetical protein
MKLVRAAALKVLEAKLPGPKTASPRSSRNF